MRLGSFIKTPIERKRYAIDYSDWLDTGETLATVTYSVPNVTTPPFVVDASSIDATNKIAVFFVNGGLTNRQYTVEVVASTSGGQIKEDTVLFTVRDVP
jgi:hypothetical protein